MRHSGTHRIALLPVGSTFAPLLRGGIGACADGIRAIEGPKMTKKAKRAPVTKDRPGAREAIGMRAELEMFKRERILKEMIELFQERGYREVTLDALAERLKVTKPFIYQFFDSKQQLIATVYERGAQQLLASIEGYLDNKSPAAKRLYDFVRSFALQNIENRAISVFFSQEEGELPPKTLEAIRAIHRQFDSKLASLIEDGIKTGEFTVQEPHIAGLAISGMVRWIHRWFQDGRLSAAEIAVLFADYALNLVGYKGSRSF
jgi:TetR/AcrR family transcriptional regulator, cholesterol catabolism regulator